jgi:hypothetical protein
MHKDYFKFFEFLATEERAITDIEKQTLADAVKIWNHNGNNTYQNKYKWANGLLE